MSRSRPISAAVRLNWARMMLLGLFALLTPMGAKASPAEVCDQAAIRAAEETGVPLDVLRAITRTETGRTQAGALQPWPWTVNLEGSGVWFDTEAQAKQFVFRHFMEGRRSIDIGCFQINYKWHGHAFSSIEEMFDPQLNARYAAQFLSELYAQHGDWTQAVGTYHSRTRKYAQRYLKKYAQVHREMADVADSVDITDSSGFPLLTGVSDQGSAGSLVPLTGGTGRSLLTSGRGG